jgi:hypothetical protein
MIAKLAERTMDHDDHHGSRASGVLAVYPAPAGQASFPVVREFDRAVHDHRGGPRPP